MKSRKKWDFMGIYGQSSYVPENKFEIFIKISLHIVSKIKFINICRYVF